MEIQVKITGSGDRTEIVKALKALAEEIDHSDTDVWLSRKGIWENETETLMTVLTTI